MPKSKPTHRGPHKYRRVKWGKHEAIVWKCVLTGCMHYIHDEFIEGKISLCYRCGNPFAMDKESMMRVKPCCSNCIRRKVHDPIADLDALIGGLD
jgi:hypothetical protein